MGRKSENLHLKKGSCPANCIYFNLVSFTSWVPATVQDPGERFQTAEEWASENRFQQRLNKDSAGEGKKTTLVEHV